MKCNAQTCTNAEAPAAFFAAVDRGDCSQAARLLASSPAALGERVHGATALHHAAARGDTAMLEFLLGSGAGIDELDDGGASALTWATDEGHDAAVDFLLSRGARATAVDLAARGRHAELGNLLLDSPWMLDQRNSIQGTALHAAIRRGRLEAVELLIARGADRGERDEEGLTARELALALSDREIGSAIEDLLSRADCAGQELRQTDALASESLGYRCGACAEVIVIDVDRTEGDEQRFVEDCPVCCRANVIQVSFSRDGAAAIAQLE